VGFRDFEVIEGRENKSLARIGAGDETFVFLGFRDFEVIEGRENKSLACAGAWQ
jgi:hypothetical protein